MTNSKLLKDVFVPGDSEPGSRVDSTPVPVHDFDQAGRTWQSTEMLAHQLVGWRLNNSRTYYKPVFRSESERRTSSLNYNQAALLIGPGHGQTLGELI